MAKPSYQSALIVGAGQGLSASLARLFAKEGMRIALAARNPEKLASVMRRDRRQSLFLRCDRPGAGDADVQSGRGGDRRT